MPFNGVYWNPAKPKWTLNTTTSWLLYLVHNDVVAHALWRHMVMFCSVHDACALFGTNIEVAVHKRCNWVPLHGVGLLKRLTSTWWLPPGHHTTLRHLSWTRILFMVATHRHQRCTRFHKIGLRKSGHSDVYSSSGSHVCYFWLIWQSCQGAYTIMNCPWCVIVVVVCGQSSCPQVWSQKLHILHIYAHMPLVYAHELVNTTCNF